MSDLFREILTDAANLSLLAEKAKHPPVRLAILEAARKTLEHAIEILPPEVQKKKYVLPSSAPKVQTETTRDRHVPWSLKKTNHNTFKAEILSFLAGAYKGRSQAENMKEMHKLWDMFKDASTIEESIKCAEAAIKEAIGEKSKTPKSFTPPT